MADDWVAVLFAACFTDSRGRLRAGLTLPDRGARVALLLDLALRGRLSADGDGLSLDTTPTGFAPADRLLAHVDEHPNQSITEVLARAPISVLDVADPQRGRRRTVQLDLASVKRAKTTAQYVADTADTGDAGTLHERVRLMLALLCGAVGLAEPTLQGALLARCGPLRPLVTDCVGYLEALTYRMELGSSVTDGGGG